MSISDLLKQNEVSGMYALIETITPEIAKQYLDKNIQCNRPVVPTRVKAFSEAMRRGEWRLSPQGISFDSNGNLNDGQHRLHAVVASGVTVYMFVIRDTNPEVFPTLDMGAKRSISDSLHIPKKEAENLVFIIRLVANTIPTPQLVSMFRPHFHEQYCAMTTTKRPVVGSVAVRTAAIVSMKLWPKRTDYVLHTYHGLVNLKTEEIPRCANVFLNQIYREKASAMKAWDLFARALVVFDPTKANVSKIVIPITEHGSPMVVSEIRESLREKIVEFRSL